MTEKEIAELRRRYRPDKNNISCVHGCCVNDKGEIVSRFSQSLHIMPEEEAEKLLSLLRKALSGTVGRNLLDLTFSTSQVADSEEHRLLMALRDSGLADEAVLEEFFSRAASSLHIEGNYLILLSHEIYDVPYRSRDGERQEDASSEVFPYILCAVCPVKTTKPALGYYLDDNEFRTCSIDWLVSPPELGFLFPAFDDRSTNLYNALYYTKSAEENHPEFIESVFCCPSPMPAQQQQETFRALLSETLADQCSCEVVQAVDHQLREMIEDHKERKVEEPLTVSPETVQGILEDCGVAEERAADFGARCREALGNDGEISPRNLVNLKQVEITTPDVTVRVKAERDDLVETRIIDGTRYILIRVEEGVEVNGVPVRITAPQK